MKAPESTRCHYSFESGPTSNRDHCDAFVHAGLAAQCSTGYRRSIESMECNIVSVA